MTKPASIKHLLNVAARWQAGDWTARAASSGGTSELAHLAAAFDAMAEAVASRELALQRAADALRHSQEHLAQAQRVAAIGSWQFDFRTGVLEWSDEVYRIVGVRREAYRPTAQAVEAMVFDEDRPRLQEAVAVVRRGERSPPIEYRARCPDGTVRHLYREAEPLFDESGSVIGMIGIVRDITEMRATERQRDAFEKQLQHAQKMDALGTLAGGIAHDVNNALVPVIALSKLLLKGAEPGSDEREDLELIHAAGQRARELVRQILTFARKSEPERRRLDIPAVVDDALRLLRSTLPTTITIEGRIERVPRVNADEAQINQVLMNLVTNAAQAIGEQKGRISVEVAPADTSPVGHKPGAVRMSVIDTGCGMDDSTCRRIFEPFFTTKGVNEGTGLGLSVVHGIVVSHGGAIAVESKPGLGTRVDVYLPTSEMSPMPATP